MWFQNFRSFFSFVDLARWGRSKIWVVPMFVWASAFMERSHAKTYSFRRSKSDWFSKICYGSNISGVAIVYSSKEHQPWIE